MTADNTAHRQIVENADFGVLVHADCCILYANPTCIDLFGYSKASQLQNLGSVFDLSVPGDRKSIHWLKATDRSPQGPPDGHPITGHRKDGTDIGVWVHGFPIEWEGKSATCLTIRKREEPDQLLEKYHECEARLKDYEQSSAGRFWETGPDLKFRPISHNIAHIDNVATDFYMGNTRDEFIVWDTDSSEYLPHQKDLDARRPFRDFTYNRANPDGTSTYISTSGVPFYDANGDFAGYRGIAYNMAETHILRRSQSQLIDALNRVSSAIALFDSSRRLIFSNEMYRQLLRDKDMPVHGITYGEALRFHIEDGTSGAISDPDAWLKTHLDADRAPDLLIELQHHQAWELIQVQTTEDGSILLISTDISEQKKTEEARRASEAYLRAFLENSPSAVFLKDRQARMLYVNETYREWQNVKDEDIIGATIYDLFPPEVGAQIAEQDRLALEERKSSNIESRTLFPDGVTRTVMAIRFPVIDSSGDVIGVSGFISDISDHFRAKEELEQKTELYTTVLDNLPIAVNVKDVDGRYILANRQLQNWRALGEDQFLGKTSEELFADPETISVSRGIQEEEVCRTRKILRREDWQSCGDGVERYLEWIKFPLINREGQVFGIGTIGTDQTDRQTVEQHLRHSKETAEIANRSKSEFLAHMSHELRTPLNAIIGFSELMMENTFGPLGHENYSEYSKDIYGAGNHLLHVISDILDISKIEAGEIDLDLTEVEVGKLMAASIKMIRSRADTAGVFLTLKIPRKLPLFCGDELRLRQIILNLLSNAVKFTAKNGRITLSVRIEPSRAMVWEVTDTGIGIAEPDVARVLKPFEQARQGFQFSHEGTGLGLYLTKTLTELHGGTLSLSSKIGVGTSVFLRFPADRTRSQTAPDRTRSQTKD